MASFVKPEAAADYRRQIARWTFDAMERKARSGYVTGGVLFGYDNLRVGGHVERRINPAEANVVRQMFQLAAAGEGYKTIAKRLNQDGARAPRTRPDRPGGWSPSSVREALHREVYHGVLVWNQTRRNAPQMVSTGSTRAPRRTGSRSQPSPCASSTKRCGSPSKSAAAVTRRADSIVRPPSARVAYAVGIFSPGRPLCVLWRLDAGRVAQIRHVGACLRYACSSYFNKGKHVCPNGLMADAAVADHAIRALLRTEILQPRIVERTLDAVVAKVQHEQRDGSRLDALTGQLKRIERELDNLAETVARGGAVPAILMAIASRETERRRLLAEVSAVKRATGPALDADALRAKLRRILDQWHTRTTSTEEGRSVLDGVLEDRIAFTPDADRRRYRLTIPIAFDRVLTGMLPELGAFSYGHVPNGIRTRVLALKGPRPRPLDDGDGR